MKFTRRDIEKAERLTAFIVARSVQPVSCKLVDGYLLNVYDTDDVKQNLQDKIEKYKDIPQYSRFIPTWNGFIETLEQLESGKFGS